MGERDRLFTPAVFIHISAAADRAGDEGVLLSVMATRARRPVRQARRPPHYLNSYTVSNGLVPAAGFPFVARGPNTPMNGGVNETSRPVTMRMAGK